jgi:hypothetical protein
MRRKKPETEDFDLPEPEKDPDPVEIDDGTEPQMHGSHELMAFLRALMFILVVLIIVVLAYGLFRGEILALWRSILAAAS